VGMCLCVLKCDYRLFCIQPGAGNLKFVRGGSTVGRREKYPVCKRWRNWKINAYRFCVASRYTGTCFGLRWWEVVFIVHVRNTLTSPVCSVGTLVLYGIYFFPCCLL
jgi:hypothetical protein